MKAGSKSRKTGSKSRKTGSRAKQIKGGNSEDERIHSEKVLAGLQQKYVNEVSPTVPTGNKQKTTGISGNTYVSKEYSGEEGVRGFYWMQEQ